MLKFLGYFEKIYYVLFLAFLIINCKESKSNKIIYYYCDTSFEAHYDIDYSISQNLELGEKLGIKLIKKDIGFCGYLFVNGEKKKKIVGAYTDVDLMIDIKSFFFPGSPKSSK